MELIKRLWTALIEHRASLAWTVASALLGSGVGVLIGTLWAHTVGW